MVSALLSAIKSKKELHSLDDAFVERKLTRYFLSHHKEKVLLENNSCNPKSAAFRTVVKDMRSHLREIYGVFQKTDTAKRKGLLEAYTQTKGKGNQLEALNTLLLSHRSTAERTPHYPRLYKSLFAITGLPTSILDLGSGLNPLSYQWLGCKPYYTASDISTQDMTLIKDFFSSEHIDGTTRTDDLLATCDFPPADVVFLFKLIDTLETQQRHVSKKLINSLHTRWIIASFPQVSIGGKGFRKGNEANWFSAFLDREGYRWQTLSIPGEEFYLINKEPGPFHDKGMTKA